MSLLAAKALTCERDERVLFEGLDFAVEEGQILQIEGPNGSGKTTLIRIICGLNQSWEGELFWRGRPLEDNATLFAREHLYFGHNTGVKTSLTAEENLLWMAQAQGIVERRATLRDRIHQALAGVGLRGYEDVPVHTLSAGQKRRVALARLLLEWIPMWVLDEPFTAIDKGGVAELEKLLIEHAHQGGSVILTTHHPLAVDPGTLRKLSLGGG